MPMTGLDAFDTTVQKSDAWLSRIREELGWESRQRAYHALRAVLHALRDRLTIEETADVSAQLPMLIRGLFYDGWRPSTVPQKYRTKEEFLHRIGRYFGPEQEAESDPEEVARAVLGVLARSITQGEVENLKNMLPAEIRELWP